jgi:1-acyl-sn-glycerol-3-phosphate acyltransferase
MGVRTLMNYKLFNLPVFGSLCKMIGHYPVYFKAETHGSFSVDQEKMAPVMEDAANHLTSGGTLSVFPEGQISKDPSTLQSFRRGSFAMAKKHKLKITGMIMHGCADCWAKAAPMGGDPAIVTVSLFDVMDLAKESDDIEVGEIAERCQVRQRTRDD